MQCIIAILPNKYHHKDLTYHKWKIKTTRKLNSFKYRVGTNIFSHNSTVD